MNDKILKLKQQLRDNYIEFERINQGYSKGNIQEKEQTKNRILEELLPLTTQTRRELLRESRPSKEEIEKK